MEGQEEKEEWTIREVTSKQVSASYHPGMHQQEHIEMR